MLAAITLQPWYPHVAGTLYAVAMPVQLGLGQWLMALLLGVVVPLLTQSLRPTRVRFSHPWVAFRLFLRVGVDVIVVDHHKCAAVLPRAMALVNPNRLDESDLGAAHGHLAAVGVAFLLVYGALRFRAALTGGEALMPRAGEAEPLRPQAIESVKRLQARPADSRKIYAHVDAQAVAAVISDWTGIPAGKMVADELQAMLNLAERRDAAFLKDWLAADWSLRHSGNAVAQQGLNTHFARLLEESFAHAEDDKRFIKGSDGYFAALKETKGPHAFFRCATGGHGHSVSSTPETSRSEEKKRSRIVD